MCMCMWSIVPAEDRGVRSLRLTLQAVLRHMIWILRTGLVSITLSSVEQYALLTAEPSLHPANKLFLTTNLSFCFHGS